MAKSVTPLIGLAVVVALAMVAVFGAMSLTNPAFAAVGAPADAELAERTFSPQDATTTVAVGEKLSYDIASLITGGGDNYDGLAGNISCVPGCATGNPITAPPTVVPGFGAINLTVPGKEVKATGRVRVSVVVDLADSTTDQAIEVDVTVTATVNEPSTLLAAIPDQIVTINEPTPIDLNDYFMSGRGDGVISKYTINIKPVVTGFSAILTGSDLKLSAKSGTMKDLVAVTVEALDMHADPNPTYTFFVNIVEPGTGPSAPTAGLPSFKPADNGPADVTSYAIKFNVRTGVNTRLNDLLIEFDGDYSLPSSMGNTSVAITAQNTMIPATTGTQLVAAGSSGVTFTPENVTVDGEKVFLSLGDMDERDDRQDYLVDGGTVLTVLFRQSAGISNPTEAKGYNLVVIEFGDNKYEYEENHAGVPNHPSLKTAIFRKLSLSEEDGGLGDPVDATGKGFKNGTTLTVFVDQPTDVRWDHDSDDETPMVLLTFDHRVDATAAGRSLYSNNWADYKAADEAPKMNVQVVGTETDKAGVERPLFMVAHPEATVTSPRAMVVQGPNGSLELGEDVLCVVSAIGSDDQGKCSFTITHPTFTGGINYVNSVDGRSNVAPKPDTFDLTASVSATPSGGSPGEIMVVQVVDFPEGAISKIEFARETWCPDPEGQKTCPGSADTTGSGSFQITIPNDVRAGVQELRVTSADPDVDASSNVTFVGPQINVTPGTVQANQRISLVGTGFSPGSSIGNDNGNAAPGVADSDNDVSKVSIGGDVISRSRINDGRDVDVDSGGNWSASVDLPLSEATTAAGERAIRVTDSGGRTGVIIVDIPARVVAVTPDVGRVGTIAVVRGNGFPSKNDEGSSFNIEVKYDANNDKVTTVSAQPDASGRFEVQLRIPTTAAIPSTNTVRVSFQDSDGVDVVTTVAHEVPEGIINLSETSGGPGSIVAVNGEGFKSFVPISLVKLGTLDVTPAPKPATDGNGMMSFDIIIPGLDVGIQTIEVHVGGTTSSTGFTVTESGINPGDIKAVAVGVEPLGDNFVNIWHFNNDLKTWSFYDAQDGSDLTHLISGETYLLQIKSTVEVILNRDTRNLTCVGANCWNQIVW